LDNAKIFRNETSVINHVCGKYILRPLRVASGWFEGRQFRQTDRRTDGRTDGRTEFPTSRQIFRSVRWHEYSRWFNVYTLIFVLGLKHCSLPNIITVI